MKVGMALLLGLAVILGRISSPVAAADAVRLYVTHNTSDEVWVIDASSLRLLAKIRVQLPPRTGVKEAVISPDGSKAYTLNSILGISVIDTRTDRLLREAEYDWSFPARALAIAPDGRRLFVATAGGVIAVDAESLAEIDRNALLKEAFGLTTAPGDRVYVSSLFPGSFVALDSEGLEIVDEVSLPQNFNPEGAYFDAEHAVLYIAAAAGTMVVDPLTMEIEAIFPGPTADLRASVDGQTLFVARSDLQISAIEVSTGEAAVMHPGDGTGRGVGDVELAFTPDGRRLFVNDVLGSRLLVFDTETRALSAEVTVGEFPSGVSVAMIDTPSSASDGCQASRGDSLLAAMLMPAAMMLALRLRSRRRGKPAQDLGHRRGNGRGLSEYRGRRP